MGNREANSGEQFEDRKAYLDMVVATVAGQAALAAEVEHVYSDNHAGRNQLPFGD